MNGQTDRVVDAVRQLNAGYNNKNYTKQPAMSLGLATVYAVSFIGQNNRRYENYVFERGQELKAYNTLKSLIIDRNNNIIPRISTPDLIKLLVVSGLTVMFAIALIYLVITQPENKSLQVLTGLLGLTLGYFVGKSDTSK